MPSWDAGDSIINECYGQHPQDTRCTEAFLTILRLNELTAHV
jgi:hypothetical protein